MQFRKRFAHTIPRSLFWLFLIGLFIPFLQAQKYTLENYTAKNGLPQNTVNDIVQDHKGYLWFATQVGATRFDGYEFELFNSSNGLPDDFVNCMLVHSNGDIWFGTQGGIGVYDGTGLQVFRSEDGLVDNRVDGMIEDHAGHVWAWTAFGMSVLTPDTILSHTKEELTLKGNQIVDVMVDSKGKVHVATFQDQGVTIFKSPYSSNIQPHDEIIRDMIEVSPGEFWYATQGDGIIVNGKAGEFRLGPEDGLSDNIVLCLLKDSKERIWCSTYEDGLFVYEDGRFRNVPSPYSQEPLGEELIEDNLGRIWLRGFGDGVWLIDEGKFKHISTANSLVHDEVLVIFKDVFGSVWMGTMAGVSKFGKNVFEIYDMSWGLPDNNVQALFQDSKGRLWFGGTQYVSYLSEEGMYTFDEFGGDSAVLKPLSFAEDSRQNIYIGTEYRLFKYDGNRFINIDLKSGSAQLLIRDLLITEDERLLCATAAGIYLYDIEKDSVSVIGEEQGLIHSEVYALHHSGNIISCATKEGISLFDLDFNHIRDFTTEDGLGWNECIDITSDMAGNLWVATISRGLSKIDAGFSDSIINYNTSHGLKSNTIYFVEFSDSTTLWIGTNQGVNALNIRTGKIRYYGQEEGFIPLEANARAATKNSRGQMWMGSIEGLVHYDPIYDIGYPTPPKLILYPPIVNGIIVSGSEEGSGIKGEFPGDMIFPYSKRSLEFHFTGIHTIIPSRNTFTWFLEGFDKEWSEPGTNRSAPYPRLPNGRYTFKVKAYNLDGVEVDQEASFAFVIKPPLWKTFWFVILELLAGLALIYGIFKYRERQLIREKRILAQKVKLRTQEIEDQKVEIEAQRDKISEQKSFVEEQRDKIALQNKEITDSILYAKRIQQAVLPGQRTLEKTLPEHFILFKPRDIVSGDFFWVEKNEERIIVCAADCTGHGVPGAFMSLLGLTFLNEIVNHDGILKASRILDRLRANIIRSMSHKDEAEQARDGMDVALVVIDPQLDILEYAGAFNPLVILRKGELIQYKADKMPIGKHVGEEGPFTNHKIQLEHGDMIYLYSDGFSDQFGGERGSKYKARPFKRLLTRICTEPVKTQLDLLETELKSWMGSEDQVDDVLIMGIRYLKLT